jgi:NADH-quinone oxidoreductase subunit J
MVLFLFVIMLLNLTPAELRETVSRPRKVFAAAASLAIFAFLAGAISLSPTVKGAPGLTEPLPSPALRAAGETAAIGESLFLRHPLPFEYSTILILVAIIGAIYLTKKRRETAQPRRPAASAPHATDPQGAARREAALGAPGGRA